MGSVVFKRLRGRCDPSAQEIAPSSTMTRLIVADPHMSAMLRLLSALFGGAGVHLGCRCAYSGHDPEAAFNDEVALAIGGRLGGVCDEEGFGCETEAVFPGACGEDADHFLIGKSGTAGRGVTRNAAVGDHGLARVEGCLFALERIIFGGRGLNVERIGLLQGDSRSEPD